jgi:DGQHR domain-containing protein
VTVSLLRVPALQIRQGPRRIYCTAIDGKRLHEFTAVSRIRRDDTHGLQGYQRPESLTHIRGIRRYLESTGAMLPNAIVVAFDQTVTFVPTLQVPPDVDYSIPGELVIPIDPDQPEHERPAWLVDGQQRAAALRDAEVASFPVAIVGFIADSEEEQRSQFIRVNSTKALPKGLIHELLPGTVGNLPPAYARRLLPAAVMSRLNTTGVFAGRIKTPTAPDGYIQDTSVLKLVEHSLYNGALYQYRDPATGDGDLDRMVAHLDLFWAQVAATWPQAWDEPPRRSRLTHGVGIQALGYVMDTLTETTPAEELKPADIREHLARLVPHVAWMSGTWRIGGEERRWNGLQNTSRDIADLVDHLDRTIRLEIAA